MPLIVVQGWADEQSCTARSEVSLTLVCLPAVRTVQAEADGLACFKVPASIAVAQALAM
jgi:hypothetical protein